MRILLELEAVVATEATEADIAFNFVILSQTESTVWYNTAFVLNCKYSVIKSVFFDQIAWLETFVWVLWWSIIKWINFFWLLDCLLCCCIWVNIWLNLQVNMSTVSSKTFVQSVVKIFVLGVKFTELTENHGAGIGKVESLSWKFVLLAVSNSHGDVIVFVHTRNTAPEKEFFKIFWFCFVQQLLQA